MRLWINHYIVGSILSVLSVLAVPQVITAQVTFKQISKESGLSHNQAECILQDSRGFMWFGTRNGLCRYDGYDIKVYRNENNPNSLSGNWIMSLEEDKSGNIWVGTYQNGLNKFDFARNRFEHYGEDHQIGSQVFRIKTMRDSSIWIGSSNGFSVYDPLSDEFRHYAPHNTSNKLNSYLVSDILETKDGTVYIATWEDELVRFDRSTGRFDSVNYNHSMQGIVNYKKSLLEDQEGNIWISAHIHGLCRYNPEDQSSTFFLFQTGHLNSEVLNGSMCLDEFGRIWIASDGGGINIFDPETESFSYITRDEAYSSSLPSNNVYTVFKDNQNRMWVGTFNKGVALFDPLMNKFQNVYFTPETYAYFREKPVISLLQDKKSNIWIGTDGYGLHQISPSGSMRSFQYSERNGVIGSNAVTSLSEDKQGNILIGTFAGGLNILNPPNGEIKKYLPQDDNEQAIHSEHVWSILNDSQGQTWLGLLGNGVDVPNTDYSSFKNIGPYSNEILKIGHPNVMVIRETSDGDIWFGTEGNGIYILDKQLGKILRPSVYQNESVLQNGNIKDIFQDSNENIWIATEGKGLFLYRLSDRTVKHYDTDSGLPGMTIMGVNEDASGNIWVTTYDGLCLLRNSNDRFVHFSSVDGLSSNEFSAKSFIRLDNGLFLAGSNNGLDVFNPIGLNLNQNIPKIRFTKLLVENKEVMPGDTVNGRVILQKDIALSKEIELEFEDKGFSIEFTALNYTHPEKCKYRYKLEGFDTDWIEVNPDRRFVSYANLESGEYIFKVIASNNDGKWGNNTEILKISILPPYWETVWFRALLGLIILGILAVIYFEQLRFHKKTFQKEQAEKDKRIIELEKENVETELQKLSFYALNRNKILLNYKTRLESLAQRAKPGVKDGLQMVIEDITSEVTNEKDWELIEPRLDQVYNEFISRLRDAHPDLSLSEIKVASYVRMNKSSKEIAELMDKSLRGIENYRYRLRKKLHLGNSASLKDYLMNF